MIKWLLKQFPFYIVVPAVVLAVWCAIAGLIAAANGTAGDVLIYFLCFVSNTFWSCYLFVHLHDKWNLHKWGY